MIPVPPETPDIIGVLSPLPVQVGSRPGAIGSFTARFPAPWTGVGVVVLIPGGRNERTRWSPPPPYTFCAIDPGRSIPSHSRKKPTACQPRSCDLLPVLVV